MVASSPVASNLMSPNWSTCVEIIAQGASSRKERKKGETVSKEKKCEKAVREKKTLICKKITAGIFLKISIHK